MQYWLIGYGNNCPSGWNGYQNVDCWKNSDGAGHVSSQSDRRACRTQRVGQRRSVRRRYGLRHDGVRGRQRDQPGQRADLAKGWTAAEFNIFGDCCSTRANFNCTASIVVRTSIEDGSTAAPSCVEQGFTGGDQQSQSGQAVPVQGRFITVDRLHRERGGRRLHAGGHRQCADQLCVGRRFPPDSTSWTSRAGFTRWGGPKAAGSRH